MTAPKQPKCLECGKRRINRARYVSEWFCSQKCAAHYAEYRARGLMDLQWCETHAEWHDPDAACGEEDGQ